MIGVEQVLRTGTFDLDMRLRETWTKTTKNEAWHSYGGVIRVAKALKIYHKPKPFRPAILSSVGAVLSQTWKNAKLIREDTSLSKPISQPSISICFFWVSQAKGTKLQISKLLIQFQTLSIINSEPQYSYAWNFLDWRQSSWKCPISAQTEIDLASQFSLQWSAVLDISWLFLKKSFMTLSKLLHQELYQ